MLEEGVQRLSGDLFDQHALNIHGNAVDPIFTRIVYQGKLRHLLEKSLRALVTVQNVCFAVLLIDWGIPEKTVGQTRSVSQQISHGGGTLGRAIAFLVIDFQTLERREVFRDRGIEVDFA